MTTPDTTNYEVLDSFGSGGGGGLDFSGLLNGLGGSGSGFDLSGLMSGGSVSTSGPFGGLGSGATSGMDGAGWAQLAGTGAGAALGTALLPGVGTALGGQLGGMFGGLFGGHATNASQQSADVNKVAANNDILPDEAAAVLAAHCNRSSDNFNDLAAYHASHSGEFDFYINEYNQSHPGAKVVRGSASRAAQQAAQQLAQQQAAQQSLQQQQAAAAAAQQSAAQQQQLIHQATTQNGFLATQQGQQLVSSLNNMAPGQQFGSQGQTAGQVLGTVLQGAGAGAVKGATDAWTGTDQGKAFKLDYIKTWAKENQLLALGGLGLLGLGAKALIQMFGSGGRRHSL